MSANSFGQRLVITTFGESHGPALGVVVDGVPAGIPFDTELLHQQLRRRRPGGVTASGESITSARAESDEPEILSGVYQGRSLGTPIAMLVRNQDARSQDYATIAEQPRVGHADDVWRAKFGHSDPRGGGRSSGRETVSRVMAGAVAQMLLRTMAPGLCVRGFARQIGPMMMTEEEVSALTTQELSTADIDRFAGRMPHPLKSAQVTELLVAAKQNGQSYGGLIELWLDGVPQGLGQPVFHKLKGDLAQAMLSVGAMSSVELGDGAAVAHAEGSSFHGSENRTERYGGIRGGISTGERIVLRVACKPTASVLHVARKGRHDPCIVPRAIPVLESMAYLVLADHVLWHRTDSVRSE